MRGRAALLLLVAHLLFSWGCEPQAPAQSPRPGGSKVLDEAIAKRRAFTLDPNVKTGHLENGLSFYILQNRQPEGRAQLWLAVDAGSVLEDEDQRGLAHFVEHMCFNGTRRFPKNAIVDFLERSGVRFGADLNAYTSFDETVYKLQVPTDRPELLDRGISILRDFADGATFDPGEVEKERGVVLEEWRLRRGAGTRLSDKQETTIANASPYVTHLPIGKAEVIKTASRDTIARYYRDWYRPDMMAVIAVGDFDAAALEAKIRREFASQEAPKHARSRPTLRLAFPDKMAVSVDTDPELPQVRVMITNPIAHRPFASAKDYRRALVEQLWNGMLNGRLDEIARRDGAPFVSALASTAHPTRPMDVFRQTAVVREESALDGLTALFREVLRVERHGFTKTELDRAKAQIVRSAERQVKLKDRRDSSQLAAQLVRSFTHDEGLSGPVAELTLLKEILPGLDLAEVNRVGAALAHGRQVSVTGPPSMAKPSEEAVRGALRTVLIAKLAPYEDHGPSDPLFARSPAAGKVTETKTIPEIGVTEWTLSNGARVVVRPTHGGDGVRMSAFSPGGTSLADGADFESARFAARAVGEGGLGLLDEVKLRKALAGKLVRVSTSIGELEEGIAASADEADLETMLQLAHLSFVAPRRDESAFLAWRSREAESFKNRQLSPEAAFAEEMTIFATQGHPRRRPPSPEAIRRVDLDKAIAFYKDRFADAGDFTFVLVGKVDLAELKPLVETYLASLPSQGRRETWRDVGVSPPAGVQTKTVIRGTEPKSMVSLTFHGSETWSRASAQSLALLVDVLRIRLREILREDMGGVYSVNVTGALARRPRETFTLNVGFGCAPENVDRLVKSIFDEAKRLQAKGIAEDYLGRVRELRRRSQETAVRDDTWWLAQLESTYSHGDDPKLLAGGGEQEKATSEVVRAAAKRFLGSKQYMLGVLRPQPR